MSVFNFISNMHKYWLALKRLEFESRSWRTDWSIFVMYIKKMTLKYDGDYMNFADATAC